MFVPRAHNTFAAVVSRASGRVSLLGSKYRPYRVPSFYPPRSVIATHFSSTTSWSSSEENTNNANNINVSIVYGSFTPNEVARRDAMEIYDVLNGAVVNGNDTDKRERMLSVQEPICGNDFDVNMLRARKGAEEVPDEEQENRKTEVLILATSSMLGLPPRNVSKFCAAILLIAKTNPGCFSEGRLHHAVWGVGDINWHDTYMNVPRYVDQLLGTVGSTSEQDNNNEQEQYYCGSTRLYARGEKGEPHAEELECYSAAVWASKMLHYAHWPAASSSSSAPKKKATTDAGAVSWDALWETHECNHHKMVRGFTLNEVVRRHGGDVVLGLGSNGDGGNNATEPTTNKLMKNLEDDEEYQNIVKEYTEFENKMKIRRAKRKENLKMGNANK